MDKVTRDPLRNHWISRALRVSREAFISAGRRDPMYLIMDAACLAAPLWPDEPYFQRPTPGKTVGGVIRFKPGTRDRVLITNVFDPLRHTVTRITVCEVAELVDNLGRLIEAINANEQEAAELLDRVRRWITHDDTLDDLPDAESWKRGRKARRQAAKNALGHLPE
jgi:hypothetical protein